MRTEFFEEESVEPQMAPLIDCVFLLLIFFLVATTLKKMERNIPVDLPPAISAVESAENPSSLVITVDVEGKLFLDSGLATPGVLIKTLDDLVAQQPDRPVRIHADRATPFEHIVKVLEALNVREISNVAVHVADRK